MSDFYNDGKETSRGYNIAVTSLKTVIRILLLVLLVLFVIVAGRKIYEIGFESFATGAVSSNADDAIEAQVSITKDMTIEDIADKLNELGLIKMSTEAFKIQAAVYGYTDSIIPGQYTLNSAMTPDEMLEIMSTEAEEDDS